MALVYFIALSLLLCLLGIWSWKKPRKKINLIFGYRTIRAMKNQGTWDFAQVYHGKTLFNTCIFLLIAGIPAILILNQFFDPSVPFACAVVLIMADSFLPIYFTEKKLKQLFDKNGNPIN